MFGILVFTGLSASAQKSKSVRLQAPAGALPAVQNVNIDGYDAAVIPNGRLVTPVGQEFSVGAPKPFGLAVSKDGNTLATINSGIGPFSITLINNLKSAHPLVNGLQVDSAFLGVVFSPDGSRFYASGGEDGNIWVGDVASQRVVGSVNLNGQTHPFGSMNVIGGPGTRFKGTFPGRIAISNDGHYLYVTDQGSFRVFVVDTTQIQTGVDINGNLTFPENFAAVVGSASTGRYPYGIALSSDNKRLYVSNVGVFQYTHLTPANPTGDSNVDYPLCYPGAGYPEETQTDRTITIHKVDPRNLPATLSVPDGIRCGYIPQDQTYTVPGLGDPNVPESSSTYIFDVSSPTTPSLVKATKTGPQVGQIDKDGFSAFSGSHPNAVASGAKFLYVSNGNNDTVSVVNKKTNVEMGRIKLSVLKGYDGKLKGVQPVAVTLSPDGQYLYVAEAGINAIGVARLQGASGSQLGLIPTGWWPSAVQPSVDGNTLYIASANGRGAQPDNNFPPYDLGSPRSSTLGTVHVLATPNLALLSKYTQRVLANNGFIPGSVPQGPNPIPSKPGVASAQIKHVIFINKENATHDLILGDITQTNLGVPVEGDPAYSLGPLVVPNHHALALQFAFGDNFYLEPSVSSDGHRWLTDTYTTEFEQTHWPASYGGRRRDAGDDPNVYGPYPGRLGFTDANSSPEPHDYNQNGGIYLHLARNGQSFLNFGNGYEFAQVDEDGGTETTGIRNHVNVPMEKVVRDNSDQLFPEYNTHIPDGPLPEDPGRFNRFGRFQQVFEASLVDRQSGICKLPAYVDLYYPNDHTGGAFDINPNGPAWSAVRFFQDNDAALGLTVDLISHSPCWKDTAIFVVEDDTQNGFDHVNGARSLFLAISPWIKHQTVGKAHYSLSSIFKNGERSPWHPAAQSVRRSGHGS
jgi:DNA-binding beta-propeller fold protein YncE